MTYRSLPPGAVLFGREDAAEQFINAVCAHTPESPCCVFVDGPPGSGKTEFVLRLLRGSNHLPIRYDASDVRNKALLTSMDADHSGPVSVMDMFHQKTTRMVTVLDDVESFFKDKSGGADSLFKMVRTSAQKSVNAKSGDRTAMPLVCIGNGKKDKKMSELAAACTLVIRIRAPTDDQMDELLTDTVPGYTAFDPMVKVCACAFVHGDLRKYRFLQTAIARGVSAKFICDLFQTTTDTDTARGVTSRLLSSPFPLPLSTHGDLPDSVRSTVALLWHENVTKVLDSWNKETAVSVYLRALDNICLADRVAYTTFQHQSGAVGDMCSLIRTFYANYLLHQPEAKRDAAHDQLACVRDIVFTKLLTKYSTEFNNAGFINRMCQQLGVDRADLVVLFRGLDTAGPTDPQFNKTRKTRARAKSGTRSASGNQNQTKGGVRATKKTQLERMVWIRSQLEMYGVALTDIKRMYRFIEMTEPELVESGSDPEKGGDGEEGEGEGEGEEDGGEYIEDEDTVEYEYDDE